MFYVDKYKPKSVSDVLFHHEIYELLKNMAKDKSIPHIIFHGPSGSGKRTMINIFLSMLYNSKIYNTYGKDYEVTGSSAKTKIETLQRSDYHIVIKPKNTNYDRYLLHDVVKKFAKTTEFIDTETDKPFRAIQIDNLDDFAYFAQTSLRRTMENYSRRCRFITWCNSLSKIIQPIQSRCICIRLPALTDQDMLKFICDILAKERKLLDLDEIEEIIQKSQGNAKSALWMLNKKMLDIDITSEYDTVIEFLVEHFIRKDILSISKIRDKIFNLYITTIPFEKIMNDLLEGLISNDSISSKCATQLIVNIGPVDHSLMRCRRAIIHFDMMVTTIMKIIHENDMEITM